MVHHCPAVTDVVRRVPGAKIDWVVEEAFAGVAAMQRAVRRVIPVALRRWRASFDFLKSPNGNFSFNFNIVLLDESDIKFNYDQQTVTNR